MSNQYTLPLSDPQAELAVVGGKGASLARLVRAGLPVPDGFHVTTAAYRQFVDENDLQARILEALQAVDANQPATLATASAQIGALFAAGRIPANVAEEIAKTYSECPSLARRGAGGEVAVRSSATAEDLPEASFAGQQETFLNVSGAEAVLAAVKRCWASLWTARAIGYRARQGIDSRVVSLAVVVQKLVPADAAGVLFTANPLNGSRQEAVLNAAWGLGEAVVGGLMTPDTLTVDKATGRVLTRDTADKQLMTVRVAGGTAEQPVPESQRRVPVLDDPSAAELVRLGVQIEKLYAMPMDIEWTLAEGQFAIVQARPITALSEEIADIPLEWNVPDPKATYARGSLAEHTPNPVSPLFATLGLRIANRETDCLWEEMIGIDPRASGMFVGDGMYMALNSYVYGAFRLGLKQAWPLTKVTFSQIGPMMRGCVARWQAARQVLADVVADWEGKTLTALSPAELLAGARTVFRAAVKYYTVIQTTLPTASMSELAFSRFYNGLVKRKSDPDFTTLLFGFETVTVRAEKSLFDIALWLKENPALATYALQTQTAALVVDFKRETPSEGVSVDLWAEWHKQINEYFEKFGRTAYEFDFAAPTPAETPIPQFKALKMFLAGKVINPYVRYQSAVEKRERATRSIVARLGSLRKRWFAKLLKWAQDAGAIREDSIAAMGLGHPLIRRVFAELGARFVAGGAIENADDVYWLEEHEVEELVAALENGETLPGFAENIPTRKAEWRAALQLTPPVALPEKSWIMKFFGGKAEEKDGKLVLKGLGTSSGQVTAPACVLYGPQDFGKMRPGDVLVATTTTPAWTPLFTLAAAVVTDIGGPLSHSSIVAREYGIPAVMAARNATRHIQSGQMLTVHGDTGTVVLHPVASAPFAITEWPRPNPQANYVRQSIVELLPDPLTPLFATLGMRAINAGTLSLFAEIVGANAMPDEIVVTINGYAYYQFAMTFEFWGSALTNVWSFLPKFFQGETRWRDEARPRYLAVIERWQSHPLCEVAAADLLEGVYQITAAAVNIYNVFQSGVIGLATVSEMLFTPFYEKLIRRKNDPAALTLILGGDSMPIQAEKSLYDVAQWGHEHPGLADYLARTPSVQLAEQLADDRLPSDIAPSADGVCDEWHEWRRRFQAHLAQYGHAIYDLDFSNPVPADDPAPLLETLKVYLGGQGANPHARQQKQIAEREAAAQAISKRLKGRRLKWFQKLLGWAQVYVPMREDTLADIGLGYPLLRRMLRELGARLVQAGMLEQAADVYWLNEAEALESAVTLDSSGALSSMAELIRQRQAKWQAAKRVTPPVSLPERSWMTNVMKKVGPARVQQGSHILKGVGASPGRVTVPACVLHGPADFAQMQPGAALVAGITTPAWTPLFALASAIVTDVGGPLSHSSIVAREYGIPAVLGTGVATKRIQSGQFIRVDGGAGTVTLLDENGAELPEEVPVKKVGRAKKIAVVALVTGVVLAVVVWWRKRRAVQCH